MKYFDMPGEWSIYSYSEWCFNNAHWILIFVLVIMQVTTLLRLHATPYPQIPDSKVVDLKLDEDYEKFIEKAPKGCTLCVDFYATWCPPCRKAAPVLAEWSKKYSPNSIRFGKVDVDKNKNTANRFGIRSLPTFVFFDSDGKEVAKVVGFNQSAVQKQIDASLKKSE
mmetsp:Transcript_13775/g.17085  ORF Transcript_13775/g.17085 Transcript_13775/m.17085 type:complete len:167 (+) Transcript_13775:259-759(+)|eukprot:CAMPEP_0204827556 /NCGR_PEP_ID=MMETSP1346-20131115/4995_1 /ASSEMBLY_ACC=CAM_ASM_000771 /TAXON_ID=215587 /ORGANISM="Aplanochytrium stocchinoi, Strain GSBS06" /LENGTH=166 /DNA_ID=CAMNT_0051956035 /DNA_START=317 /DNA_END=817 /DNA_ORIENTATION=+